MKDVSTLLIVATRRASNPRISNNRGRCDATITTNNEDGRRPTRSTCQLSTVTHNRTPALRRQRTNARSITSRMLRCPVCRHQMSPSQGVSIDLNGGRGPWLFILRLIIMSVSTRPNPSRRYLASIISLEAAKILRGRCGRSVSPT